MVQVWDASAVTDTSTTPKTLPFALVLSLRLVATDCVDVPVIVVDSGEEVRLETESEAGFQSVYDVLSNDFGV